MLLEGEDVPCVRMLWGSTKLANLDRDKRWNPLELGTVGRSAAIEQLLCRFALLQLTLTLLLECTPLCEA